MQTLWAEGCLGRVPLPSETGWLADEVRCAVSPSGNLDALCSAAAARVVERDLGAELGESQAALVPQSQGGFRIWVDPTPCGGWGSVDPTLRVSVRRHRLRFRVAHELAHTLFYRRTNGRPRRVLPGSPEEERFADDFARALLVPSSAANRAVPTPPGLLNLQRACDVSIEVAARALHAAHARPVAVIHWLHGDRISVANARMQWGSAGVSLSRADLRRALRSAVGEVPGLAPPWAIFLPRRRQVLWVGSPQACESQSSLRAL